MIKYLAPIGLFLSALPASAIVPINGTFISNEEGWTIRKLVTNQCVMETRYTNGTVIAVALVPGDQKAATIYMANPAWSALKIDEKYPVSVEVGKAVGTTTGYGTAAPDNSNTKMIMFAVDRQQLVDSMFNGRFYGITVNGHKTVAFTGRDRNAIMTLTKCAAPAIDPFSR